MRRVISKTIRSLFPRYPFGSKMGDPQTRSERVGEKYVYESMWKKIFESNGNRTWSFNHVAGWSTEKYKRLWYIFLVQLKEKLAKHCFQVKGCGQGVNNTMIKGRREKWKKKENMRSWKKYKCNREEDTILKEIEMEAAGRWMRKEKKNSDCTEEARNAVVWSYGTV